MNKKLLLGTTALVAGGVVAADMAEAADPLRLEVRGYRNEAFGVVSVESDVENENFGNTNHRSDGEIHFRGSTTLDNGIEVGVRVELEAFTNGDQIDENYVFLEGGFGRLLLGSDDPAPYIQAVVAPAVGAPINSGWLSDFIPEPAGFQTGSFSTTPEISVDDNMITYFSPRFAGFQLGVSYIPQVDGDNPDTADNGAPFNAGEGSNTTNRDFQRDHGFATGINYTNSFNGIDVSAAGGFQYIDGPDDNNNFDADGGGFDGTKVNDIQEVYAYNGGLNIGFGGFTFGGSIGGFDIDSQGANHGFHWDVGLSYETGPWGVSGTFIAGEREGGDTTSDEDESLGAAIAVSYVLGPGVKTSFTGMYADYDAGEDNTDDGEGFGGVLTLRVDF
ncbi:MAG: porin [Kiloniellales bacterium]|nr:porin [Kiloniellales bacterium]